MKLISIASAIIVAISQPFSALAQQNISSGKERPTTAIIPYDSPQAAMEGAYTESSYLQPLTRWTRTAGSDKTEYTTEFKKPFAWADRQQILHLDGAAGSYNVYVNGKHIGWNQSGMTPSDFDVTKYSIEGNNTLKIEVLNNDPSRALENRQGSGKYRSAISTDLVGNSYICAPPKVRVRDFIVNTSVVPAGGLMELGLMLKSILLNSREVKLYYQLFSPSGQLVSEGNREAAIDMRREDTIRFLINVAEPRLWNHENPQLYTVVIRNVFDGRDTEYVSFKTAFLDIGMSGGNLTVNGAPLDIVAVRYEPVADVVQVERDLGDMIARGVNTIMAKCGPQSESFYNLTDRLGLYVCVQADINTHLSGTSIQRGGNPSNDPQWTAAYIDRVLGMYHTSKSHPSVAMFSLAENSANGICLYESYLALKAIENNRPVIYLDAGGQWNSDATQSPLSEQNNYDGTQRMVLAPRAMSDIEPSTGISIKAINPGDGIFAIENTLQFTPLNPAVVEYKVSAGRRKISSGTLTAEISPRSSGNITIPTGKAKTGEGLRIEISVSSGDIKTSRSFDTIK